MMTSLTLALLSAAPCERVVVAPFEPLATSSVEARKVEDEVRDTLSRDATYCVEPRAETVKRLLALPGHRLPVCDDCAAQRTTSLDAAWVIEGVVLGVGGRQTVELTHTRATGSTRAMGERSELPALLSLGSSRPAVKSGGPKWPAFVAAGLAVGAAGVGLGLGLSAQQRSTALSQGTACAGQSGSTLQSCLEREYVAGQSEATGANVLYAVGGGLLAAGVVLFVVELP